MHAAADAIHGWLINGFQATVAFWVWLALVLLYGIYRSAAHSDPDPIRPSGPIES